MALSFLVAVIGASMTYRDGDFTVTGLIFFLILLTVVMCLLFVLPYYMVLMAAGFALAIVDGIRGVDEDGRGEPPAGRFRPPSAAARDPHRPGGVSGGRI